MPDVETVMTWPKVMALCDGTAGYYMTLRTQALLDVTVRTGCTPFDATFMLDAAIHRIDDRDRNLCRDTLVHFPPETIAKWPKTAIYLERPRSVHADTLLTKALQEIRDETGVSHNVARLILETVRRETT